MPAKEPNLTANWLQEHFVSRGRQGVFAKGFVSNTNGKWAYSPQYRPLSLQELIDHCSEKSPIGLYTMLDNEHCQLAVLDFDNKTGEIPIENMLALAQSVNIQLKVNFMFSFICLSGSGKGVHLWLMWKNPQKARAVRQELFKALTAAGAKKNTGKWTMVTGSDEVPIDVFPAQDNVDAEGLGNLVALPFNRKSIAVNDGSWKVDPNFVPILSPQFSKELELFELSHAVVDSSMAKIFENDAGLGIEASENALTIPLTEFQIFELKSALDVIPADNYHTWISVGISLKTAVKDGQLEPAKAFELFNDWSKNVPKKYDEKGTRSAWDGIRERSPEQTRLGLGSIFFLAKQNQPLAVIDQEPTTIKAEIINSSTEHEVPIEIEPSDTIQAKNAIKEINKSYFVVNEGGKTIVMKEDYDESLQRKMLVRMGINDFKSFFMNRYVMVAPKKKTKKQDEPDFQDLGNVWLKSPQRRQYDKIGFHPHGLPPNIYNLWRGWAVEPQRGDWSKMKKHIFETICSSRQDVYEYVYKWMCRTVQFPAEPIGTALVLYGGRGTGKGIFARTFGSLFGQHFIHLTNTRQVTGNFNGHLRDAIVVFADEAVWAGNKSEESVLKGLVTEPTIPIERKGQDIVSVKNLVHMIVASNNDWAIPAGPDERRFMVVEVDEKMKQSLDYFAGIVNQMQSGGLSAMLWDLLNEPLGNWSAYRMPETNELRLQKELTLSGLSAWWMVRLYEETPLKGRGINWAAGDVTLSMDDLFNDYIEFCREQSQRAMNKAIFSRELRRWACVRDIDRKYTSVEELDDRGILVKKPGKKSVVVLGSFAECQSHFDKLMNNGNVKR